MRIVFDSNVWIAALVASGTSKDVVEKALDTCEVFISPYIIEEVDRALAHKIGATKEERTRVKHWLEGVCLVAEPKERKDLSCDDPKDLPILWLALSAHADLLITGDQDLLRIKEIQGIKIISPAFFWKA